mgnify:FL=1|jgi:hypothetical protein
MQIFNSAKNGGGKKKANKKQANKNQEQLKDQGAMNDQGAGNDQDHGNCKDCLYEIFNYLISVLTFSSVFVTKLEDYKMLFVNRNK